MTLNLVDIAVVKQTTGGVPRNGRDQPLIVPRSGGKPTAHTRLSSFADCLEDKTALGSYNTRNAMMGAALDDSLREAVLHALKDEDEQSETFGQTKTVATLTMADKRKLDALAEKAKSISGADRKSDKGTQLHELSELVDAGEPMPEGISEADLKDMAAYKVAMLGFDVIAVEQFVVVEEIKAAGTFDRVLFKVDPWGPSERLLTTQNLIGDIKTGRVDFGGLKMSCQLAGYSRGWLYDWTKFPVDVHDDKAFTAWKKTVFTAEEAAQAYAQMEAINQEWGVIINLPAGSGNATLHWVDLTLGWEAAQEALRIRALRSKQGKALLPFAA